MYRTDTQGEIIIRSDGQTLTVTTDPTSREPAARARTRRSSATAIP